MGKYLHKTLIDTATPDMTFEELYYFMKDLRQHRTKTALQALHTICLHLFRHIAQVSLVNREIGKVLQRS